LKGHGSDFLGNLLEIDCKKEVLSNVFEEINAQYIKDCSKPESFWFKGFF